MPELKVGDTGWTIEPNIEADGYGDIKPRQPWMVKIAQIKEGGIPIMEVDAYNPKTNTVDEDSNATAYIRKEQFFTIKEEADKAYVKAFLCYIKGQLEDALTDVETLESFIENKLL